MSSVEIAHAVILGSKPERRVSAQWHKGGSYTVTLLEQTVTPIWRTLETWQLGGRSRRSCLQCFAQVVEAQWRLEETQQ